jgi:hypothetical protein
MLTLRLQTLSLVMCSVLLFSPLHLEASTTRSEFLVGDRFTISAHLFNDGGAPTTVLLYVTAPPGFEALGAIGTRGDVEAGHALSLNASYQVVSAPPGLYTFLVQGGGQTVRVVIRVGPVVARPARPPVVYFPAFYG